ncbi:Hypothetical predicted protein [Lynx pardinus]|uniref:C2orf72-like C-terminal domain-containing protein n=1 Tax=Lynx pardinus TaxID=191816 RepID=A0A485NSX9_LYNPA|nr:Hypothetical predicted protein [Lynx pardinus]
MAAPSAVTPRSPSARLGGGWVGAGRMLRHRLSTHFCGWGIAFLPPTPSACVDVPRGPAPPPADTADPSRARQGCMAGAWERPGLPALLACFSWGPWSRGKDPDATSPSDPAQGHLQDPEEELALTDVFPNGDCEDPRKGLRACDGFVHAPAEPAGDSR